MTRSLNKVTLIGNLGNDPEIRATSMGKQVVNISIATTSMWNDRSTGGIQERTEWHRVVLFDRLAEIAGQYLKKGNRIYLEGSLRNRSWDHNGQKKFITEILCKDLIMLDGRAEMVSIGTTSLNSETQANRSTPMSNNTKPTKELLADTVFDDDIPF